jgi:hypothetical protein
MLLFVNEFYVFNNIKIKLHHLYFHVLALNIYDNFNGEKWKWYKTDVTDKLTLRMLTQSNFLLLFINVLNVYYSMTKSVPITTNVVSSNSAQGEVYSIQHYVIKFVRDLRQVGGVLRVFRIPSPIKLTATIYISEILLKVALNTTTPNALYDKLFSVLFIFS